MAKSGFQALKSKFHSEAIVKTLAWSIAAGILAVGVLNLTLRFQHILLSPLLYVAIGVGTSILVGLPLFFILYQSDKRLARTLDNQYGLNESVQTMIEYQAADGEIVSLQREAAELALGKLSAKFDGKKVLASCIAVVLAIGVFVTSVFVPVPLPDTDNTPPPVVDKPFALTDYHKLAVNNLVDEVRAADADEQEKTQVAARLQTLLGDLQTVTKRKRMVEVVAAAMLDVDGVADRTNTCDDVYKAIAVSSAETMQYFAVMVATADVQLLDQNITDFLSAFANEQSDYEKSKTALDEFNGSATAAITLLSTAIPETDGLLTATKAMANSVSTVAGGTYDELQTAIKNATLSKKSGLELALSWQYKNRALTDTCIERLQLIFELSSEEVPDLENDWMLSVGGVGGGSGDDDHLSDGALPEGDTEWASDDEIFDPDKGEYVPYGDLIVEYQMYINDIENTLSDEVKKYFSDYFSALRNAQETE